MIDSYALFKMASQLRKDTVNLINVGHADYNSPNSHISLYNNIRKNLEDLYDESNIVNSLPIIEGTNYESMYKSKFIELSTAAGQITSFLSAVLGNPDKKIDSLKNEINLLEEKKSQLEEINKTIFESLNKYIKSDEFSISNDILNNIPKDISSTLQDALRAYGAGSYTGCVCVCRNIIEGLVQEQCTKEGIKENGLNRQINALISAKKIEQKHNQTLLNTLTVLGNRSAHSTTELFTKEKASLVLNGLLILMEEVFT